ncbi:MAG TPA: selenium cofactor biosynthesis protein YqeC [Arsenophonus nasoniae]|uniref:selenium cofactor biosynthesis protein YqeC n=1 Tax=Arsenophonus nasoniae TaxID=638 RepID=UPI003879724B
MPQANIPEPLTMFCDGTLNSSSVVISLIGAGGKTSALFWLARQFSALGKKVIITTTTRMYLPEENIPLLICRDPTHLPAAAFTSPISACYAAWQPSSGKVRGFLPQQIDALGQRYYAHILLVEADGSRGLPLKAPALHEPCIPVSSRCVIAVTGGQVLAKPLGPDNVQRWPLFASITQIEPGDKADITLFEHFIRHPAGMFKNVPLHAQRIWLINRFSQSENFITNQLSALLKTTGLDAIWLGAVRESPPIRNVLQRQ